MKCQKGSDKYKGKGEWGGRSVGRVLFKLFAFWASSGFSILYTIDERTLCRDVIPDAYIL